MSIFYFFLAFCTTGIALIVLKPVAIRVGLIDIPGGRKAHIDATPLVGGIGIFLGVLIATSMIPGMLSEFGIFLSLSAIVLFIGVFDDFNELAPLTRMSSHALVALAMAIISGNQLNSLGDLLFTGPITLGVFTIPLTIFATVGVINAINMSDGIDGLSGGLVTVALGYICVVNLISGSTSTANISILLIFSLMAFLAMNFRRLSNRRALVYLGDAGSTMLGFMLAWLLIDASQGDRPVLPPVYALWIIAVPLFDTVYLLIKRPLLGRSPFAPGDDHLHHNLMRRGYNVEQVVLILVVCAIAMGGIGAMGIFFQLNESIMFLAFLTLFAIYFILIERINPISRIAEDN